MTQVRVRCVRLDEGVPAAIRDTEPLIDVGLDERHATPELAAALQELFQEAIDSERWQRAQVNRVTDSAGRRD